MKLQQMNNPNNLYEELLRPVLKCNLALGTRTLTEAYHVIDNMDECAQDIASEIKDFIISTGTTTQTQQAHYNEIDMIYSGYNFNAHYKETLLSSISSGIKPEPCLLLNDETVDYPIYYQLEYNESSTSQAQAVYRDIQDFVKDKVVIVVNVALFKDIDEPSKRYRVFYKLISTIYHELQHIFDMYVLPEQNSLDTRKQCGMTIDFKTMNVFDVPAYSNDYRLINAVLGMLAPEEINARLAELKSLISTVSQNDRIRKVIFYQSLKNDNVSIPREKFVSNDEMITEDMLFHFLSTNNIIQSITRCNMFSNYVLKRLTEYKINEHDKYCALMLIIGYYLFSHDLMCFPENVKKQRAVLNNFKMLKSIIDIKTMTVKDCSEEVLDVCDEVFKTIVKLFYDYINNVDVRLRMDITAFFKYKKVSEMFEAVADYNDKEIILL